MKTRIKRLLLAIKYRKINVRFGKNSNISIDAEFGGCNRIGKNSLFIGRLGYGSYICDNCSVDADVGKYCSIASRVVMLTGTHPIKDWVTTHPAFFSTMKQNGMTYVTENKFDEFNKKPVVGNDVWIGDSALIMGGVVIGDGAVVGAGAVVTKDVPPYAIVAGVPAKIISYRFNEEEIEQLLKLKWWDKPENWIRENIHKFDDVRKFVK